MRRRLSPLRFLFRSLTERFRARALPYQGKGRRLPRPRRELRLPGLSLQRPALQPQLLPNQLRRRCRPVRTTRR
jgi:hypothetical protein